MRPTAKWLQRSITSDRSPPAGSKKSWLQHVVAVFNDKFQHMLEKYDLTVNRSLLLPMTTLLTILGVVLLTFGLFPLLGTAYFPRVDPGQFVINLKAPTGTKLDLTNDYVARVEKDVREVVAPRDLNRIVSNIG